MPPSLASLTRVCGPLLGLAMGLTNLPAAVAPVVGQPLPAWERGMLDIHQINAGKGDAAFFIFPDGTTFLLDAGAVVRARPPQYDSPQRPDATLRPGQWIARAIRRAHPEGERGALDYAALTHFHDDHMGSVTDQSPVAPAGTYKLTGITDVAEAVPIRTMIDRGWPDYSFPAPLRSSSMFNYRAFLEWQSRQRGLRVERFQPGRAGQFRLLRDAASYPGFEFRNIAANGQVWTGEGEDVRQRYPDGELPGENDCSLAFRISYGAFAYFNGGDMAGVRPAAAPSWSEIESAVAWVTGPVDVHALNHHGFADSANAFFLSVLQPRIHILSVYAASHPGPDVMRRLLSEQVYPGPRDIFMTNGMWEGRSPHMVKLFGEAETAWLVERIGEAASVQGHVVVRVAPGGDTYRVIVLDDRAGSDSVVRSVHGPYEARARKR